MTSKYTLCTALIALAPHTMQGQTPITATKVADMHPIGSRVGNFLVGGAANDRLYFHTAGQSTPGGGYSTALHITDGTSAGTRTLVRDPSKVIIPLRSSATVLLYERAWAPDYSIHTVDPNAAVPVEHPAAIAGAAAVAAPAPADGVIQFLPTPGAVVSSVLGSAFIVPKPQPLIGEEPWSFSTITPSEGTLIKDITPGPAGSLPYFGGATFTHTFQNRIYMSTRTAEYTPAFWVTDGTTAGTVQLPSGPVLPTLKNAYNFFGIADKIYFTARDLSINDEPWCYNITTATLTKLKEIDPSTTTGSAPSNFTAFGSLVYFTATSPTKGRELWVTDGTTAGTKMVSDIHPSGSSDPKELTVLGTTLIFSADNGTKGRELWTITKAGGSPTMMLDLHTLGSANPRNFTVSGSTLYFFANTSLGKLTALYRTDGTAANTTSLFSLPAGHGPRNALAASGKLYFVTEMSAAPYTARFWRTNTRGSGATEIVLPGTVAAKPFGYDLGTMGGWVYFSGNPSGTDAELWKVQ